MEQEQSRHLRFDSRQTLLPMGEIYPHQVMPERAKAARNEKSISNHKEDDTGYTPNRLNSSATEVDHLGSPWGMQKNAEKH